MKLKSGMEAPELTLTDYTNTPFVLSKLRGTRVMLSFYRYAGCPFCQLRYAELVDRFGSRDDIKLVAVFQSPNDSIKEHAAGIDSPVIVIGDPGQRYYKVYGVDFGFRAWVLGITSAYRFMKSLKSGNKWGKKEGQSDRIPADFLIDKEGILRHVYYGKHMDDHMPVEWIENFLKI